MTDKALNELKEYYYELGNIRGESFTDVHDLDDIETVDDYQSALFESETSDRDFSPFEFTAKEINDYYGTEEWLPDELWESFDSGIGDAIQAHVEANHDAIVGRIVEYRIESLPPLVHAVIEQLGTDDTEELIQVCNDIQRGGIDAGFHGFTYYHETVKFHDDNEELIWDQLYEECGDYSVIEYIATFPAIKNVGSMDQFKNLLSWYAAEWAVNQIVDLTEEVDK